MTNWESICNIHDKQSSYKNGYAQATYKRRNTNVM